MQKLVTILNTLEAIDVNFYNFRINLCLTLPRVTSIDSEPVLINTNTLLAKPSCTLRLHQAPFNLSLVDSFLIFFKLWNYFEYSDNIIYYMWVWIRLAGVILSKFLIAYHTLVAHRGEGYWVTISVNGNIKLILISGIQYL